MVVPGVVESATKPDREQQSTISEKVKGGWGGGGVNSLLFSNPTCFNFFIKPSFTFYFFAVFYS